MKVLADSQWSCRTPRSVIQDGDAVPINKIGDQYKTSAQISLGIEKCTTHYW